MGSACRLLALLSVLALAEAVHTGATVELCRSTPRLATSSVAPHAPVGRRTVLSLPGSTAVAALLSGVVQPAVASGGATAGKTTSIPRAKLRYYDRIIAAVASFQEMDKDLTAGSLAKSKAFFAKDGPYDELMGAGYLLAVAFKIDSKIPPDKIPNVKMHKKMIAELEKVKGLKKPSDAPKILAATRIAMNDFLEGVELPPLGDSRYDIP